VAREMLTAARAELGLLVGAGVSGLASCFASAAIGERLLGGDPGAASDAVTVEAVEQDGNIFIIASRSGRPLFGVALTDAEALRMATQMSEIFNRRPTQKG